MQSSKQGDDFIAIPVFSDFIQTAGEWAGTWIAVVGGLLSLLLLSLILGDDMFLMNRALGFGFLDFSFMGIVLFSIYGFLIVIGRSCGCRSLPCVGRYCQQYEKVIVCRATE